MLGRVAGCLFTIWNGFGSSKFKCRSYSSYNVSRGCRRGEQNINICPEELNFNISCECSDNIGRYCSPSEDTVVNLLVGHVERIHLQCIICTIVSHNCVINRQNNLIISSRWKLGGKVTAKESNLLLTFHITSSFDFFPDNCEQPGQPQTEEHIHRVTS